MPPKARPGVEYVVLRMTFGRRIELMRRVRDLAARLEYFEAGRDAKNGMEASLLGAEIDRLYIRWGVRRDSRARSRRSAGDVEALIESGPEDLFFEALTAVKAECGLDGERKKKLIVAFHFVTASQQFPDRAGWNCESCRQNGLEVKRRCGFLEDDKRGQPRIVWGRKHTQTDECPKSLVTGESLAIAGGVFRAAAARDPGVTRNGSTQGGRVCDSAGRNGA